MNHLQTLEFDIVLQKLAGCATSTTVKERCLSLAPANTLPDAVRRLTETTQAKKIIEQLGSPPLAAMTDLQKTIGLLGLEAMLTPDQMGHVLTFILSCRRMKEYLKRALYTETEIAFYGGAFVDCSEVENEISRCIRAGQVDDRASQLLYDLRKSIDNKQEQIKGRLEAILKKNKEYFSESFVALRNGRYTVPVKKECKGRVEGLLIELSKTGGTCFIEPAAVRKLQDELSELQIEEDSEVRRILYTLTALIYDNLPAIHMNREAMETLDFLFAKGKLSIDMKASPVRLCSSRDIRLLSARHPLLGQESAVPLDFALDETRKGIVVTGPNTGGKTVALKTVGLLSLMAQSGLHVPADGQSTICLFDKVLCDIGDGQSITENLSTFSSHMTNILAILRNAGKNSLVLLDELGSGTDPAEGMGIAMAVLEELLTRGCLFTVTTHYPQIKDFAAQRPGICNARMAFDRESLMPLYRLEIGEAGESCALYIAQRLGMPEKLLQRAREITYAGARADGGEWASAIPAGNRQIVTPMPVDALLEEEEPAIPRSQRFQIGDSVIVYPKKEIGIVCTRANEKGELGVQLKGNKILVNHKRVKLKVAAAELYPEDYDFSIIFDSVVNRKARHLMEKKHVEGVAIVCE